MIFTIIGFFGSFYLATWAFATNGYDKGMNIMCSLFLGVGAGMVADAMTFGILAGKYLL